MAGETGRVRLGRAPGLGSGFGFNSRCLGSFARL